MNQSKIIIAFLICTATSFACLWWAMEHLGQNMSVFTFFGFVIAQLILLAIFNLAMELDRKTMLVCLGISILAVLGAEWLLYIDLAMNVGRGRIVPA